MLDGRQIQAAVEREFGPLADAQLVELTEGGAGLCLECGEWRDGVEPDACKYECPACHARAVYGSEEILLRCAFDLEGRGS